MRNFKEKVNAFGAKVATGAALVGASIGTAMAQSTDPSDQIITAVQDGGANAIKVAVAFVVVLWSLTAIYLMRRKG